MIKMLNFYTTEIDDPDMAVKEILAQIKQSNGFLKNSVGIIGCCHEFIDVDFIEKLSSEIPFDIIGCTSRGSAVNKSLSMEQLSLSVLTSDDIEFSVAFSDVLTKDNIEIAVPDAYKQAYSKLSGDPSFIFTFAPMMIDVSGETIMQTLDDVSGGVPIFGVLSNDISASYENGKVFCNGESHSKKIAMILMKGNINPHFFITSVPEKNLQNQYAIVTDSDGYLLKSVNGKSLIKYLESMGVTPNGLAAITVLPFIVNLNDGTEPYAVSMHSIDRDGAFCSSKIPIGSSIVFAEIDRAGIISTIQSTLTRILEYAENNKVNGIIIGPCFARNLVLNPNSELEMQKTSEILGQKIPFMIIYSGGEICPVYDKNGKTINRFHNLTYTAVAF